jgi:4-amino-4-deoxy-L-arabinose transferase-like glycosyltransferase
VLAGALLGLAALTRANGAALVIPVAFLVWTERPRWSWRALRAPLTVAVVAGLALVPWIVRNAVVLHEFEPLSTESGYALAGTYDADARAHTPYPALWIPPYALPDLRPVFTDRSLDEAAVSARLRRHALDYIKEHPTYPLVVGFWNGARLLNLTGPGVERWAARYEGYPAWLAVTSVFAFWVVAALGLVGAVTRAARRAPLAFWACPLVIVLSCTFVFGLTRYRAPADPWVVLLATLGLLAAVRRVREPARPVARTEVAARA